MRLAEAFASSESVVAVMRASDGVFLDVNAAFERSTGWRRDQVIGRIPNDFGLWADPAFRSRIWSELRATRRAVSMATRITCADGRVLGAHLSCEFAVQDGEPVVFCLLHVAGSDTDVTEPEPDHRLYRSLYLAASEGIYRSLPGGGFLDVNPAMARTVFKVPVLTWASPRMAVRLVGALVDDMPEVVETPRMRRPPFGQPRLAARRRRSPHLVELPDRHRTHPAKFQRPSPQRVGLRPRWPMRCPGATP